MSAETADRRLKGTQRDHSKTLLGVLTMMKVSFFYLNCARDEMCVHYAEPETKAQSKQWKQTGCPPHSKFKLLAILCLLLFGDSRAITQAYFMQKGKTVAARY